MSTGPSAKTREIVLERDVYRCVSCARPIQGQVFSIHHRLPRGMGGTSRTDLNLPANLLVLCGSGTTGCHGWIESHRERGYEWGYLIRRGTASPTWEPVLTADGWRRFDNDGTYTDAYPGLVSVTRGTELSTYAERARLERLGEVA